MTLLDAAYPEKEREKDRKTEEEALKNVSKDEYFKTAKFIMMNMDIERVQEMKAFCFLLTEAHEIYAVTENIQDSLREQLGNWIDKLPIGIWEKWKPLMEADRSSFIRAVKVLGDYGKDDFTDVSLAALLRKDVPVSTIEYFAGKAEEFGLREYKKDGRIAFYITTLPAGKIPRGLEEIDWGEEDREDEQHGQ